MVGQLQKLARLRGIPKLHLMQLLKIDRLHRYHIHLFLKNIKIIYKIQIKVNLPGSQVTPTD